MDTIEIKNSIIKSFYFLLDLGYHESKVYENREENTFGIVFENVRVNQKISIIFYERNPINFDLKCDHGLLLKLFRGNEHIDFSRLLKEFSELSIYAKYQYFIIPNEYNPEEFLKKVAMIIFEYYKGLLLGKYWIINEYDLRDDY